MDWFTANRQWIEHLPSLIVLLAPGLESIENLLLLLKPPTLAAFLRRGVD